MFLTIKQRVNACTISCRHGQCAMDDTESNKDPTMVLPSRGHGRRRYLLFSLCSSTQKHEDSLDVPYDYERDSLSVMVSHRMVDRMTDRPRHVW
jgi:hypothetical protein